jgi:hypothetical protein
MLRWLLRKRLLVLFYVIYITNADVSNDHLEAPLVSPTSAPLTAPAIPDLPLPADLPMFHKPRHKHFSPRGAPTTALSPAHPPFYGALLTPGHPPTSSRLSKPLMKRSVLAPPIASFKNIAPTQSSAGAPPSGLAQPPLSPSVSGKLCSERTPFFSLLLFNFYYL